VFDYIARLHHTYSYTTEYIIYELDLLTGWLLYAYAYVNEPVHKFSGIEMVNSPTARESESLLNELWLIK
jgi:hypothetical protein